MEKLDKLSKEADQYFLEILRKTYEISKELDSAPELFLAMLSGRIERLLRKW